MSTRFTYNGIGLREKIVDAGNPLYISIASYYVIHANLAALQICIRTSGVSLSVPIYCIAGIPGCPGCPCSPCHPGYPESPRN
uniref:Uncharacterized protein n=1 Tax=Heterorhabditis bacteriophora TaxID=37862 RepID=A0A1I7XEM5_HETBA